MRRSEEEDGRAEKDEERTRLEHRLSLLLLLKEAKVWEEGRRKDGRAK